MHNIRFIDRILRTVLGLTFFYFSKTSLDLYSILALILFASAFMGFCPSYALFGINREFAKKNNFLEQLPMHNPEPVFIFCPKGSMVFRNSSAKRILPKITHFADISDTDSKTVVEQESFFSVKHPYMGKTYMIEAIGIKEKNYILAYGYNITEIEHKKQELKNQLVTDSLTGLSNSERAVEDFVKNNEKKEVLMVFDIVKFNQINSFFGASKANKILITFAQTLQALKKDFPNIYNVYRLRGNTFALLLLFDDIKKKSYKEEATAISEQIFSLFEKRKLQVDDIQVNINLKMGIASNSNFQITEETKMVLLRDAEMALSEAKNRSLKVLDFEEIQDEKEKYKENLQWADKLHDIIYKESDARFSTYFQPIYNLKDEKIEKFEALIRIEEGAKVFSPFFFLEVAAQTNILPKITKHVLQESCNKFQNTPYEFSINISAQDFLEKNFIADLQEQIQSYSIKPSSIVLEILEDEDMYQYTAIISQLKQLGFKIAIDDFGTGYSNFKKLQQLHADYIKIDGSLVKNIVSNPKDLSIIISICTYAKTIGAKTIAEFVADKEIFELLKQTDIDYVQGYFIGEPSPKLENSNVV